MSGGRFIEKAKKIGEVVEQKNKDYGNSALRASEILKILYPNGVPPDQYAHMLLVVRILDKISRIANGAYDDSYEDISGYGILGSVINNGGI